MSSIKSFNNAPNVSKRLNIAFSRYNNCRRLTLLWGVVCRIWYSFMFLRNIPALWLILDLTISLPRLPLTLSPILDDRTSTSFYRSIMWEGVGSCCYQAFVNVPVPAKNRILPSCHLSDARCPTALSWYASAGTALYDTFVSTAISARCTHTCV